MFARILLLTALVGLVLPGTVLAQDDWSGSLVPSIGRPPLGRESDALSDRHSLMIGTVLGLAYELGTPFRPLALRAGALERSGWDAWANGWSWRLVPTSFLYAMLGWDCLDTRPRWIPARIEDGRE